MTIYTRSLCPVDFFELTDIMFKNALINTRKQFESPTKEHIKYPVDIYLEDDKLNFDIAVVGIDKKDDAIKIEVEDDELMVSFDNEKKEVEGREYITNGITHKSFKHNWKINTSKCDLSELSAKISKGLLHIEVPIRKEAKKRTIYID